MRPFAQAVVGGSGFDEQLELTVELAQIFAQALGRDDPLDARQQLRVEDRAVNCRMEANGMPSSPMGRR